MATWNENADPFAEAARMGALRLEQAREVRRRQAEMADPMGAAETAGIGLLGRYLRRSRLLADLTQQQLADKAGVSQSMVSRAERGLAPSMAVVRLVRMLQPLARLFPFGVCPHDHNCPWQPVKPVEESISDPTAYVEYMLKVAGR
ncbi:MAG TPA: helix-turn-helix transcriptional regulator [Candidatus Limnocylindrales bacterium]|jgi:DNA-binding XRE family transcriptional regulator